MSEPGIGTEKDHSGKRFGRLIAIRRIAATKVMKTSYLCRCDCGKEVVVRGNNLVSGTTKSCGCLEIEKKRKNRSVNYEGVRFGRLTAIKRIEEDKRGIKYDCLCDCGNIIKVSTGRLQSGNTKSCGCLNKEKILERNRDPKLILKRLMNCSNTYRLNHWNTGEIIFCKGRWERNVVLYLNENAINFTWQIPFVLSDGRTYIVDFYDIERDTYVEIKGRWIDDSLSKFTLFKADNPLLKVEVWDKDKLISLNIPIRERQENI